MKVLAMEIPKVHNTHVYVDPHDPEAWMIVIRSDESAPARFSCSDDHGDPHEWVRDVERSVDLRRMIIATRHLHDSETEEGPA